MKRKEVVVLQSNPGFQSSLDEHIGIKSHDSFKDIFKDIFICFEEIIKQNAKWIRFPAVQNAQAEWQERYDFPGDVTMLTVLIFKLKTTSLWRRVHK